MSLKSMREEILICQTDDGYYGFVTKEGERSLIKGKYINREGSSDDGCLGCYFKSFEDLSKAISEYINGSVTAVMPPISKYELTVILEGLKKYDIPTSCKLIQRLQKANPNEQKNN